MQSNEVATVERIMSTRDFDRLRECEAVIEEGLRYFEKVGKALLEIQTERLYRAFYKTFDEYCQERWHFKAKRAYQYIAAASVSTIGRHELPNERVARALLDYPEEDRPEILELSERNGGLTSGRIHSAAKTIAEKRATGGYVDIGDGTMKAADAALTTDEHETMMRRKQHIADYAEQQAGVDGDTKYKGVATVMAKDKKAKTITIQIPEDLLNGVEVGEIVNFAIYVK